MQEKSFLNSSCIMVNLFCQMGNFWRPSNYFASGHSVFMQYISPRTNNSLCTIPFVLLRKQTQNKYRFHNLSYSRNNALKQSTDPPLGSLDLISFFSLLLSGDVTATPLPAHTGQFTSPLSKPSCSAPCDCSSWKVLLGTHRNDLGHHSECLRWCGWS